LFVHEKVFDQVVEGVVARAKKLKLGAGTDASTEIGPVVSDVQRNRVMGYIEAGRGEGAKVLVGGTAPAGEGYFVEPTVLTETTRQMRVVREEIFGPVLCAMKFNDTDLDAIARMANDTDYGLAASIWTRDISTAHKLAKKIRAGSVRINTAGTVDSAMPLGGYKQSGWGRENGREGTEIYTEVKSVTVGL
jgi:phenylacetaldehyde dehydrogenase